ncbi:MAG: hypothetical protein QM654_02965 [Dysgonamonadaceae bacterium]
MPKKVDNAFAGHNNGWLFSAENEVFSIEHTTGNRFFCRSKEFLKEDRLFRRL